MEMDVKLSALPKRWIKVTAPRSAFPTPNSAAPALFDSGHTGAVTLIQRFGSALNLFHFHLLFLDGVYVGAGDGLRSSTSATADRGST